MKTYRFRCEVSSKPRLDEFLAEQLSVALKTTVSKSRSRALIVAGAVYLNGARVRIASKPIFENAEIKVAIDEDKLFGTLADPRDEWIFDSSWILFEDEGLIAINKPFGLPTQPTIDEARANLYKLIYAFLKERDGPNAYLGLHHRLDRDTSGVVLMTKKKELNLGVAELFTSHKIQKTYVAVCEPNPLAVQKLTEGSRDGKFKIKNFLGKLPKSGRDKRQKYGSVRSGGDVAETFFEIVSETKNGVKFLCQPKTGRTHQIRVHLFGAGLPIVGDDLYGRKAGRLMLHAWKLVFIHPIYGTEILIEAPVPKEF
ncbi:MAG: RluA family pseudouridine synthase [Xanthomonadaceae bacterium]|nr:RluA family pseudouridine synthase [Xanthomonadaceae bacterium]